MMRRLCPVAAMALVTVLVSACSDKSTDGGFDLRFPSPSLAIATESLSLQAFVINDADGPGKCTELITRRAQSQPLPTRELQVTTSTCDFFKNAQTFKLPYGTYAFMAVGVRQGKDLLIGCNVQVIGEGNATVALELFPILQGYTEPPATCPSLGDFCGGRCK